VKKQLLSDYDLKNFYLFAGLDDAQRERLCKSALHFHLEPGEFLFEHGHNAERFFILLSGHIKLIRLSPEGTEKVIEIINPGESFAEAIMFMPRRVYPVSAQTIVASELLGFDNNVFLGMLEESFETSKRVLRAMSMRLRMWLNEIDNLTLQNATYRLVHYLLSRIPKECQGDCVVDFKIPKHIIASRLSVKPETLSRIFHQLADEGLIETEGRGVKIHSAEKLRQYVYFDLD
jgi:CRP/FNR family transcriptional regulator, dissimilatory nitrate respiration regulator